MGKLGVFRALIKHAMPLYSCYSKATSPRAALRVPNALKQFHHRRPAREQHGPADGVAEFGVRVNAETVINGRADVGRCKDAATQGKGAVAVRLAVELPWTNAAPRQKNRVTVCQVIAPGLGVDARRAAEFAHPHEQPALGQPTLP